MNFGNNIIIKYQESTDNGVNYLGTLINMDIDFEGGMKSLCEKHNVSIFWQLEQNGDFFISIDFCAAKICTGSYNF